MSSSDASTIATHTYKDSIAVICGGGSLPGAVAEAIVRSGRRPVMLAINGWADASVIERYPHHWIALGQAGRLLRLARAEGCREGVFIGTLARPPVRQIRLDWKTIRMMPRLVACFRGGDDKLLTGVARLIEEEGLRIIGAHEVAPEILVAEGLFGLRHPSERDQADIALGMKLLATLGPFDVGQAVVVADNNVLAIEAAEGTDNMLARIGDLRRRRRIATQVGVGVLVKAPKPHQDRRFDLPSIGPKTIEAVARAGLAGVAVTAGSAVIAEAASTIAAADRAKVFLVGVREDAAR